MATPLEIQKTFVYFRAVRISCCNPSNYVKNKQKHLLCAMAEVQVTCSLKTCLLTDMETWNMNLSGERFDTKLPVAKIATVNPESHCVLYGQACTSTYKHTMRTNRFVTVHERQVWVAQSASWCKAGPGVDERHPHDRVVCVCFFFWTFLICGKKNEAKSSLWTGVTVQISAVWAGHKLLCPACHISSTALMTLQVERGRLPTVTVRI